MQNINEYSGINLFIGSQETINTIPAESKHYALVATTNAAGDIISLDYYDPITGKQNINAQFTNFQDLKKKITTLAAQRSLTLDPVQCTMLHLPPQQIQSLFPKLLNTHIKPEIVYANAYFSAHPEQTKFNRKNSGLSHSYMSDEQEGVFQSANKDEIRVIWSHAIPNSPQDIFKNLPDNTAGVYIVDETQNKLFYLQKGENNQIQFVSDNPDLNTFANYKLNNQGLSKETLSEIESPAHQVDTKNVYGSGAFGRVKKSIKSPSQAQFATKSQKIKKAGRFSSKMEGRQAEIKKLQNEADIIGDLGLGSSNVGVRERNDKKEDVAYVHMHAKGMPLNEKTKHQPLNKKLDYAIKFLIEVDRLHSGAASKRGIPYAHRDLKPANALVDENDQVTLVDYGSATTNILSEKNEATSATLFYAPLDQEVIDIYAKKPAETDLNAAQSESEDLQSPSKNAVKSRSVLSNSDEETEEEDIEDWSLSFSGEKDIATLAAKIYESPQRNAAVEPNSPSHYANWTFCLTDPKLCITQNYLEDDKIAALRTVYNHSHQALEGDSILNTQDFSALPAPIQKILNSDKIRDVLSEERRHEPEGFYAAVLIRYQQIVEQKKLNRETVTDQDCENIIKEVANNPQKQQAIIQDYQAKHQIHQQNRKRHSPTPSTTSQENLLSPKSSDKKNLFIRIKERFTRRRSAKISPDTVSTDLENFESPVKIKPKSPGGTSQS